MAMTNRECFDVWAPADAEWCAWAKPSLFAQMGTVLPLVHGDALPPATPPAWVPDGDGRTALVVDMPGAQSVAIGVALAQRGYRPVPLFNTTAGAASLVDADAVGRALVAAADALRAATVSPSAAPAFLLDALRMRPATPPAPGRFDNRWIVFPQDFPSATLLQARGVREVLVLHDGGGVQDDLAHVLLRWQQGGLAIRGGAHTDSGPGHLSLRPPAWFRMAWYRLLAMSGLRRNDAGGFGGIVPTRSSGG